MKRIITLCVATILLIGIGSGCGTIMGRSYPSLRALPNCHFYPATVVDAASIFGATYQLFGDSQSSELPSRGRSIAILPLSILDLPISVVTDTVLLPFDFVRDRKQEALLNDENMNRDIQQTNAPYSSPAPQVQKR